MEKKQKTLGNKGFSLVELIIVIAIMAVLVVVLAPQFIKFVEKGRESTDLQNVTELKTAVETYVADKALPKTTTATITMDRTNQKIVVGGLSAGVLKEYGVDDSMALESKDWSADIQWEYKDYKWTIKTNGNASYYNADGTDKT